VIVGGCSRDSNGSSRRSVAILPSAMLSGSRASKPGCMSGSVISALRDPVSLVSRYRPTVYVSPPHSRGTQKPIFTSTRVSGPMDLQFGANSGNCDSSIETVGPVPIGLLPFTSKPRRKGSVVRSKISGPASVFLSLVL
jgi:hypothetical protein